MLLARMVLTAVTTTMAMKNSMRKTGRRRSFHRVLLRSSGIRKSRNHRTARCAGRNRNVLFAFQVFDGLNFDQCHFVFGPMPCRIEISLEALPYDRFDVGCRFHGNCRVSRNVKRDHIPSVHLILLPFIQALLFYCSCACLVQAPMW